MHFTLRIMLFPFLAAVLTAAHPQPQLDSQIDPEIDSSAQSCPPVNPGYNVSAVAARATALASHSWEYGTCSEALLELHNPSLSVFSSCAFPNNKIPKPALSISSLSYAKPHIRTSNSTLIDGDGASGDPASLGVSAVLIGQSDSGYLSAAQRQLQHLFSVPRLSNGAISQRDANAEAWADFMYMAPPFMAYWAVASGDLSLINETVRQSGLYRQKLKNSTGYWHHIDSTSGDADSGIWSTGNGWAAAGMARVLATLVHWGPSSGYTKQRNDLVGWIKEIVDGARSAGRDNTSGLLRNYLNDGSWFGETSGTALLASVVYRMAVLAPETFGKDYISWADDSRKAVSKHVESNGMLSPAVNPLGWGDRMPYTAGSPEGQSFGVLLYAAYRDCVCAEKCT